MAEELMDMQAKQEREQGFVLITSLIIMGLMLVLSIGLWYRSAINQQVSASGQKSTQAFYYAESAINYVAWALATGNDAELDGEDTNGSGDLIPGATDANTVGDWTELVGDTFRPGPSTLGGTDGQLAYFDNRTIANRNGFAFDAGDPAALNPDLSAMITSSQMPMHLVLNIDASGNITLPSPAYSTSAVPTNGAVVWLTAVASDSAILESAIIGDDVQLDTNAGTCTSTTYPVACIEDSVGRKQVENYDIAVYAVAYVDGIPLRFLRAVIGTIP